MTTMMGASGRIRIGSKMSHLERLQANLKSHQTALLRRRSEARSAQEAAEVAGRRALDLQASLAHERAEREAAKIKNRLARAWSRVQRFLTRKVV